MGLRLRKSIKIGGFRINIGKSGIGYSFGVPGARFTKKAGGGSRFTLSIPRTGISYTKDSKKSHSNQASPKDKGNTNPDSIEIYSEILPSSSNQLIDKMNEATKTNQWLLVIKIICGFVALFGLYFLYGGITNTFPLIVGILGSISMLAAAIAFLMLPKSATIDIDYSFDDAEIEHKYNCVLSNIKRLTEAKKVWEIYSVNIHNDAKSHAGAAGSASRKIIKISDSKLFNSNYHIQEINVQNKKIIFLPDTVSVYQNDKWLAIEWEQLNIILDSTMFVESEQPPSDAVIVGYTYLHPNKNGGPDRRYSNNPKLAKCQYSVIGLESTNGLEIVLMISNQDIAKTLYDSLIELKSNNLNQTIIEDSI